MSILRSVVIMKTDICEYTPRTRKLSEAELRALLNQQKKLVVENTLKYEGSVVKGEGDSFWLIFPSVTTAALAAIAMQQELLTMQMGKGDDERISIRICIALGDVLYQDNDIFGDAVNLTARIESVTPKDEIFLSQAAYLALNKAEVQASFVNNYALKGFEEMIKVYRIEQKHRTRVIRDQNIVYIDINGFSNFYACNPLNVSEELLLFFDEIIRSGCEQYGGIVRIILGDCQIVTFTDASNVLSAVIEMGRKWHKYTTQNNIPCRLHIGVHKGNIHLFRSHLYGESVNMAARYASMGTTELGKIWVITSQVFRDELVSTEWENRLRGLQSSDVYYLDVQYSD